MQQQENNRRRQGGFTLVEIMVVVVILGLLATLVAQNVIGNLFVASETKAQADVGTIASAIKTYQLRNAGTAPESIEVLLQKDARGNAFLDSYSKDPWGQDYQIRRSGDGAGQVYVVSFGPDKREDTDDDIRSDGGNKGGSGNR
jgi:general secretion pathway protein G